MKPGNNNKSKQTQSKAIPLQSIGVKEKGKKEKRKKKIPAQGDKITNKAVDGCR